MRKVLFLFGEFSDRDIDWIIGAGTREATTAGQHLIHQGRPVEDVYILLQGRCQIILNNQIIAERGAGEFIGELSFLDSRPPLASVVAKESGSILVIRRDKLASKLRTDTDFSSRFYRGIGVMLASRLRDSVGDVVYEGDRLDEDVVESGELSTEMLENVTLAAMKFEDLLNRTRVY